MSRIIFNETVLMHLLDDNYSYYRDNVEFRLSYDELVEFQNLELATGVFNEEV